MGQNMPKGISIILAPGDPRGQRGRLPCRSSGEGLCRQVSYILIDNSAFGGIPPFARRLRRGERGSTRDASRRLRREVEVRLRRPWNCVCRRDPSAPVGAKRRRSGHVDEAAICSGTFLIIIIGILRDGTIPASQRGRDDHGGQWITLSDSKGR